MPRSKYSSGRDSFDKRRLNAWIHLLRIRLSAARANRIGDRFGRNVHRYGMPPLSPPYALTGQRTDPSAQTQAIHGHHKRIRLSL
jgi:hypothetical protein